MKHVKEIIDYWKEDELEKRYLGEGITVAVLDSGITLHPDFDSRIQGFYDFVEKRKEIYDDSGHGTHVAGILAGSGKVSNGEYAGIAPKASLVIGKVLDHTGNGMVADMMEAIGWIHSWKDEKNIRVVNISVGAQPQLDEKEEKRLLDGVESLWDAGLVVVVSAGNYGPRAKSVAVPGNSRKVITVGASQPIVFFERFWERARSYSGRGPTEDCVVKPDVIAPGTDIISCNGGYVNRWKKPYVKKSGTSMATPIVSGAIACLLSKYPDMTNVEVKLKLRESCVIQEKENLESQGWGMINMKKILK